MYALMVVALDWLEPASISTSVLPHLIKTLSPALSLSNLIKWIESPLDCTPAKSPSGELLS